MSRRITRLLDLESRIDSLRTELNTRLDNIRTDINARLDTTNTRLSQINESLLNNIQTRLQELVSATGTGYWRPHLWAYVTYSADTLIGRALEAVKVLSAVYDGRVVRFAHVKTSLPPSNAGTYQLDTRPAEANTAIIPFFVAGTGVGTSDRVSVTVVRNNTQLTTPEVSPLTGSSPFLFDLTTIMSVFLPDPGTSVTVNYRLSLSTSAASHYTIFYAYVGL